MSKLLKLKRWITLDAAADRLTNTVGEKVVVADLLQFALDKKIDLSVRLIDLTPAKRCERVAASSIEYNEVASIKTIARDDGTFTFEPDEAKPIKIPKRGRVWQPSFHALKTGEFLQIVDSMTELDPDVWGFPLLTAANEIFVRQSLQSIIGGAEVTDVPMDGIVVENLIHELFELQSELERESDEGFRPASLSDFYPSPVPPRGTELVITTADLLKFEESLIEPEPAQKDSAQKSASRSAETRTEGSLLSIIRALLHGVNLKPDDKNAASTIQRWSQSTGHVLTDETIKKYLKQISDT